MSKNQTHIRTQPGGTAVPQKTTSCDWTYTYGTEPEYSALATHLRKLNVNCRATLDISGVARHTALMEIASIKHKGLRQFFERGNPKGLVGDTERLRKMLAFIDAAEDLAELSTPPNFGFHELTGDRKGTWSMTVTRNWRLTFCLNDDGALSEMNLEDYHGS